MVLLEPISKLFYYLSDYVIKQRYKAEDKNVLAIIRVISALDFVRIHTTLLLFHGQI